jgi:predicted secreted hydrolase
MLTLQVNEKLANKINTTTMLTTMSASSVITIAQYVPRFPLVWNVRIQKRSLMLQANASMYNAKSGNIEIIHAVLIAI